MATRDYLLQDILDSYSLDEVKIRGKARALLDDRMDEVYRRLSDQDIPTSAFMEIMKFLSEIGDMKPKKDIAPANPGAGFSITINIPQADGKPPVTIEGRSTPIRSELDDEDEELPTLSDGPMNFNTLDFRFNHDLTGGMSGDDDESDY